MHRSFIAIITTTPLVPSRAVADQPFFQGLGTLQVGGTSRALSISADGSVVVGEASYGIAGGGTQAFRWTRAGGMIGLGYLPGSFYQSSADGVSADGSIIVGTSYYGISGPGGVEAYRWTEDGGMVSLGRLPGGSFSRATGISADGSFIVGSSNAGPNSPSEACRWDYSGVIGLGRLPGGRYSIANGISADGSVVVGTADRPTSDENAFRWTKATGMMELSDPYYVGGDALAVSADGSVVVGRTIDPDYFGYHAFRWTQSTGMITLLPPNAPVWDTEAFAVSADGSIIVGTYSDNVWSGAFIWDAVNGIRSLRDLLVNQLHLDLTGWTSLGTATGISADGLTVVGTGSKNTPSFHQEAWIATSPNPPRRFSC